MELSHLYASVVEVRVIFPLNAVNYKTKNSSPAASIFLGC